MAARLKSLLAPICHCVPRNNWAKLQILSNRIRDGQMMVSISIKRSSRPLSWKGAVFHLLKEWTSSPYSATAAHWSRTKMKPPKLCYVTKGFLATRQIIQFRRSLRGLWNSCCGFSSSRKMMHPLFDSWGDKHLLALIRLPNRTTTAVIMQSYEKKLLA